MGRLIVFEGTDGSGKATQTELLCQTLEARGTPFRRLAFPRYDEESSALTFTSSSIPASVPSSASTTTPRS